MTQVADILAATCGSIIAPAGHGKTELIAKAAAQGERTLILTHTHAGIQALRSRLKRMRISAASVAVDTMSGWCLRYAHAFPLVAKPPNKMPINNAEWDAMYHGVNRALAIAAIQQVVRASYDRVLIDEYQDCGRAQHAVAITLAGLVPTILFGDPMQGVFEFAGATLNWSREIHPQFPSIGSLDTPYRWQGINPDLGAWIARTRDQLMRGERIDLMDGPIEFRQSDNAFDMRLFFEGHNEKEGSFAAIHCWKDDCYSLAKATSGYFQAIEENAAKELGNFGAAWDRTTDDDSRKRAFTDLFSKCFRTRDPAASDDAEKIARDKEACDRMGLHIKALANGDGLAALVDLFQGARTSPFWKLFRDELWRDAERATVAVAAGRAPTMTDAADQMRQRAGIVGRRLPMRTVASPLLLKGLEFDHVLIPLADHYVTQQYGPAKLFYCAISRAKKSLTISARSRYLQFSVPPL